MTENEDTNFVSHGHARATSRDPTRHFRAILARALASVDPSNSFLCESIIKKTLLETGASILGGMEGTRPPQFLDWGDEYLIVPPIFSYAQ